jgi:hypothetical protein
MCQMSLKSLIFLAISLIVLVAGFYSCSNKTDDVTQPPLQAPDAGSGSIKVYYGMDDSLSFSGEGKWPLSGNGVAAAMDSTHQRLLIIGFTENHPPRKTGINGFFTFLSLALADSTPLTAGTYHSLVLTSAIDIDTSRTDSLGYTDVNATLILDSVTQTRLAGRFSGIPVRMDGSSLAFHDGEFHVSYVTGIHASGIVQLPLRSDPDSVVVGAGYTAKTIISGGIPPYWILYPPTPEIATASVDSSMLTINGIGFGRTEIGVADNSVPRQVLIFPVITSSFSGDGTCSFSSELGDFFARGPYSPTQTRGSMIGAYRTTDTMNDYIQISGFRFHSSTDADYFSLMISAPLHGDLAIGEYAVPDGAIFLYASHINPHPLGADTTFFSKAYHFTSGSVELMTLTGTSASGILSGQGPNYTDPSEILHVSNGSFSIDYATTHGTNLEKEKSVIDKMARDILTHSQPHK